MKMFGRKSLVCGVALPLLNTACAPATEEVVETPKEIVENVVEEVVYPSSKFDLSHWSLTLPIAERGGPGADVIIVPELQNYEHPDYFYLNDKGHLVFMSPNKAATEVTSTNTRSELRYESRGADYSIAEDSPKNNWAIAAKDDAEEFDAIGGKLEASLYVDHVSLNAGYPNKSPAYSIVVGQIHAYQFPTQDHGYGWGNEPLKISYKKWPNHEKGSVFWTYERNLDFDDPDRIDIEFPVWGSSWDSPEDPGDAGIALGEEFSYTVNVHENTMYVTFEAEGHPTVEHQVDLSKNYDELDHPNGYTGDYLYYKAGGYNQCSTKNAPTFRYPACPGTGDLERDIKDGNYSQVTFTNLVVSDAEPVD
ncbi:polysaccharide lyase family 7 protein [Hirschia maritima]|uniref:polysaccharide lyase family 7 protein n=1 Tax=Hirschia maritima TaxID=1121961 RepID=UPI00036CBB11|nr:polysaccharide lyase family 7 protein [Hirschia maritima]